MSDKPIITKATAEVYKFRMPKCHGWANFTIQDHGEAGRIQIASDWGDYQYYWRSGGRPFKQFLTELGHEYVASKFGQDSWFDIGATVREFKTIVNERRRGGSITSEQKKALMAEIVDIDCVSSEIEFYMQIQHLRGLMSLMEYPSPSRSIAPMFKIFWKMAWKPFVRELKRELAAK